MTTLDITRTSGSKGPFSFVSGIIGTLAAWNDARVTRKSLSKLTKRELEDIGLCSADIDTIAVRGSRF